ncbi:MAG: diguanylate cyclase [Nitrospiraceae bacterium]|nr:MAG: diguanylate cyclase [Nitrospiraceae bacterium]
MIKDNDMSTLGKIFSSKEWADFFNSLSDTIHFELQVFSEDNALLYASREHPVCKFIRDSQLKDLQCPAACREPAMQSSKPGEPVIYKCKAGLTVFSFFLERSGEKVCVRGTGGFASYEDLLEFIRLAKIYNLPSLPTDIPMVFYGTDYVNTVAHYVCLVISRLLVNFDEKTRIEEKFLRMTSLFDSSTFVTLSRNPELMRRYVLDTLEFILGPVSSTLMVLNRKTLTYASVYSIGRHRDDFSNFYIDAQSPLMDEMFQTKSYIYSQNLKAPVPEGPLQKMEAFYFFPIFTEGQIEKVIGIFDRKLTREDVKIMNAFTDYLHLNFENRRFREYVNKLKKADERFAYFLDFSNSIASVLSKERLFHTLVEKSLQLLNAEQGSLMLLDNDTSELVVEAKKSVDETVQERMRLKKDESIAGIVIDTGEPLLVNDIERDPRFRRENRYRYKTKSFMSLLLKIDDRVKGVLNISDKAHGDVFTEDDLKILQSFVNNAAIAIERSLLYKQAEELKQLSITDPLTGIYNRRYLNHRLSEEITRYNRYKHSFSFMMLDLDKFKEYNDTFGHISGDKLIKALATIMEKSLRNVDIAARFGGDEFVAIFPQTTKEDAIHITNRLKEKIDKAFQQEGFEMQLTISMGLTTFPDDATSVGELLEKTDQALYLAKKGGGDKVMYL